MILLIFLNKLESLFRYCFLTLFLSFSERVKFWVANWQVQVRNSTRSSEGFIRDLTSFTISLKPFRRWIIDIDAGNQ